MGLANQLVRILATAVTDRLNHHEPAYLLGSSDGMWLKLAKRFNCLTPGARETASSFREPWTHHREWIIINHALGLHILVLYTPPEKWEN